MRGKLQAQLLSPFLYHPLTHRLPGVEDDGGLAAHLHAVHAAVEVDVVEVSHPHPAVHERLPEPLGTVPLAPQPLAQLGGVDEEPVSHVFQPDVDRIPWTGFVVPLFALVLEPVVLATQDDEVLILLQ